jgi:hypothetical protein
VRFFRRDGNGTVGEGERFNVQDGAQHPAHHLDPAGDRQEV